MNKIKINFVDFWGGFVNNDNFFYNLLIQDYDVEISDDPDVLFFSVFGNRHLNYNCTKVFFTGENIPPNFSECDYAFTFDYLDDERNYRLPLYVLYDNKNVKCYSRITEPKIITPALAKRKFCNYVVSNGGCRMRNLFIEKLSEYKPLDSGGRWQNNVGGAVRDKIAFQNQYKFSIAFENDAYRGEHNGYTTEKIVESMVAVSMPLYWGNPVVNLEFNTESFVSFYDFGNIDKMIDYIKYLDNNDDAYLAKLAKNWHYLNEIPRNNRHENIKEFLHKVING
jgi:hypothetical protein